MICGSSPQRSTILPKCHNCTVSFPNLHRIAGKVRNLSHRRYCLECNPFKSRHRGLGPSNPNRTCERCGRGFRYEREQGLRLNLCGPCVQTTRRIDVKRRLVEMKGGQCQRCGYDKCLDALHFHHRDPSQKKFRLGNSGNRSFKKTVTEAKKCDLLCANCHIETHMEISRTNLAARKSG